MQKKSKWLYPFWIGLWAGAWFVGLGYLNQVFHTSQLEPLFLAEPIFHHSYLLTLWGNLFGVLFTIFVSACLAFTYAFLLGKQKGPWLGLGYGALLYVLLALTVAPWLHILHTYGVWRLDTFVVEACRFLLWGVFVGYSISYEFSDVQARTA
jgi:hypothetical protein